MTLGEDVAAIRDGLTDIKVSIARTEERLAEVHGDVSSIHRQIHGNGRPGLLEEVTTLRSKVNILWRAIWTAIGAGASTGAWFGFLK